MWWLLIFLFKVFVYIYNNKTIFCRFSGWNVDNTDIIFEVQNYWNYQWICWCVFNFRYQCYSEWFEKRNINQLSKHGLKVFLPFVQKQPCYIIIFLHILHTLKQYLAAIIAYKCSCSLLLLLCSKWRTLLLRCVFVGGRQKYQYW